MAGRVSRSSLGRECRAVLLLLLPYGLFAATFSVLLLRYGGYRHAILGTNHFCVEQSAVPAKLRQPWGNNTVAPQVVMQISDLHTNDQDGGVAKQQMKRFAKDVLPRWAGQAQALLVTGDLVNSGVRNQYPLGSRGRQLAEEWSWVSNFAIETNRTVPWIAVHGNHDTFGGLFHQQAHLADGDAPSCMVKGRPSENGRVRKFHMSRDGDLHLLALDCVLPRPLNRPLNFFGDANAASVELEESLDAIEVEEGIGGNILAFAHYPSSIMRNGERIHEIARRYSDDGEYNKPRFAAFLSGHLHTLKELAPPGLQVVSKSGAFELELADMVDTGTYRILAFDNGLLSFSDFRMRDDAPEDIIVTNPPRAGFCSAGAGAAARTSTHVRLVASGGARGLRADIDGVPLGEIHRLPTTCETTNANVDSDATGACGSVYGVAWDPRAWDDGKVHMLSIHTASGERILHRFSLNGAPEPGWWPYLVTLRAAIFALSEFDRVVARFCEMGFVLCVVFLAPGMLRRQTTSMLLAMMGGVLAFGPFFIVAPNLTADAAGWGFAGLRSTVLPTGVHGAGVDAAYVMSVTVLWGTLLPLCYVDMLVRRRVLRGVWALGAFLGLYVGRAVGWMLEVAGAHGGRAAVVSASGLPLVIVSAFCARRFWRRSREDLVQVQHEKD